MLYTPNEHVVRDVVQVTPVLEPWSCRTKKKTNQMNENTRNFRSPSLLLVCAQPINRNLVICIGEERVQYLPDVVCCAFAFYLRRQRGLLLTKRYASEKKNETSMHRLFTYVQKAQDWKYKVKQSFNHVMNTYRALSKTPTRVQQHKPSFKLVGRQFQNKNLDH